METEQNQESTEQTARQKPSSPKSNHPLPSAKLAIDKQYNALRAFAIASGSERDPVSIHAVADILQIHSGSISMCNPFFVDAKLISKVGHKFTPADEVFEYAQRMEWEDPDAGKKLAPVLEETWFAKALIPRLKLKSIAEKAGIGVLSEVSNASPSEKRQLVMLIDYLEYAGLLIRENGTLIGIKNTGTTSSEAVEKVEKSPQIQDVVTAPTRDAVDESLYTSLTIPIPGCSDAFFQIPKGLDEEDWEFFTSTLSSYLERLRKKEGKEDKVSFIG